MGFDILVNIVLILFALILISLIAFAIKRK